jgi:hypothetical protein
VIYRDEAIWRVPVRREVSDRGLGAISTGTVWLSADRIEYRPAILFRLPGYRLGWEATRSDVREAKVVERLPSTGGSHPRPRVCVRRTSGNELVFWPSDRDVEGAATTVSAWISTGRVDKDPVAAGGGAGRSGLFPSKRGLAIGAVVVAVLAFPAVGFVLGYLVLSSHSETAGVVGLVAGTVVYFILTQVLSATVHVVLVRRKDTEFSNPRDPPTG